MNSLFAGIFLALALLVTTSCEDSEVNPDTTSRVELSMKAVSSGGVDLQGGRLEQTITITEAYVGIEEIELETLEEYEAEMDSDDDEEEFEEQEFEWEGPFVFDLMSGASDPAFPASEVEAGIYKEFEAELIPVVGDTATLVVRGTFGDVAFEYVTAETLEFEVENEQGFEISAKNVNSLLVQFDMALLFEGVDFGAASVDADGVIRISATSNTELAAIIATNFENVAEYGKDEDDDDELDDDED
jgi:hypothetical protein